MIRPTIIVFACLALAACAVPGGRGFSGDSSGLVGQGDAQIRATFGAPAFVRKDGTAQIWRYDGMVCKAFFFFYANGSALAVKHVETLPHPLMASADAGCLASLQPGAQKTS